MASSSEEQQQNSFIFHQQKQQQRITQLPGENGFHARDGSLTKKKLEQWAKERAESNWSIFGCRSPASSGKKPTNHHRSTLGKQENNKSLDDNTDNGEQQCANEQQQQGKDQQQQHLSMISLDNFAPYQHCESPAAMPMMNAMNNAGGRESTAIHDQHQQQQMFSSCTTMCSAPDGFTASAASAFKFPAIAASSTIQQPPMAFPLANSCCPSPNGTMLHSPAPLLLEYPLLHHSQPQPHPIFALPNFLPATAYPTSACFPMPYSIAAAAPPSANGTFLDPIFLAQKMQPPPPFNVFPTPPFSGSSSGSASSPPKELVGSYASMSKEFFTFTQQNGQQQEQQKEQTIDVDDDDEDDVDEDEEHEHLNKQKQHEQQQRWQAQLDEQLEQKRIAEQMEAQRRREEENMREREEAERKSREEEQRAAEMRKRMEKFEIRDQHEQACLDGIQRAQREAELLKRAKLFRHILLDECNHVDMDTAKRVLKTEDEQLLNGVLKQLGVMERERRISATCTNGTAATKSPKQSQQQQSSSSSPSSSQSSTIAATIKKVTRDTMAIKEKGSTDKQQQQNGGGNFCRANSWSVKQPRTIPNMSHLPVPVRAKQQQQQNQQEQSTKKSPTVRNVDISGGMANGHPPPLRVGQPTMACNSKTPPAKVANRNNDAPERKSSSAKQPAAPGLFEQLTLRRSRPGSLRNIGREGSSNSKMMTLLNGQGQQQQPQEPIYEHPTSSSSTFPCNQQTDCIAENHANSIAINKTSGSTSNGHINNNTVDCCTSNGTTTTTTCCGGENVEKEGNDDEDGGGGCGNPEMNGNPNQQASSSFLPPPPPPFTKVTNCTDKPQLKKCSNNDSSNNIIINSNSVSSPQTSSPGSACSSTMETASVLKFRALLSSPSNSQEELAADFPIVVTPRSTSCPVRNGPQFLVPPSPFSSRKNSVNESNKGCFGDLRQSLRSPTMRRLQDSLQSLATIDGNGNSTEGSRCSTPKPFNCRNSQYRSLNLRRDTARQKQILEHLAAVRAQLKNSQAHLERTMSKQNLVGGDEEHDVQL